MTPDEHFRQAMLHLSSMHAEAPAAARRSVPIRPTKIILYYPDVLAKLDAFEAACGEDHATGQVIRQGLTSDVYGLHIEFSE